MSERHIHRRATNGRFISARPEKGGSFLIEDELTRRMRNLPQELSDKIYHYTFTAETRVCKITPGRYDPPARLQVDRASRDLFATSFYEVTTFSFKGAESLEVARYWANSLPDAHRQMVKHVKFSFNMIVAELLNISPDPLRIMYIGMQRGQEGARLMFGVQMAHMLRLSGPHVTIKTID